MKTRKKSKFFSILHKLFPVKKLFLPLAGTLAGAVNGLFGGGGGMIVLPALERAGCPVRSAHATALAVILPATLVSALVYLFCGVPFGTLLPVLLGTSAGGLWGAALLPRLREETLSFLFALLMLLAGVRMLLP